MKNNKKLGIILLLVVLLPALFFSVYEIGSLSKNEEIIGEIYNSQLEVILTSVNQYSDDVAESWAFTVNNIISSRYESDYNIRSFMDNYPAIRGFFISRDTTYNNIHLVTGNNQQRELNQQVVIENLLRKNGIKTKKLFTYYKARYRKIEPLAPADSKGLTYFIFIVKDFNGNPCISGIIVNTHDFVSQFLAPRIQMMVKERFIIDISNGDKTIYSSEPLGVGKAAFTRQLWLLPELKLGIVYKGKTIKQLVRERTYLNFGLIMFIDLLFLIGTWFVFKSFKTEIQLAKMRSDFIANVSHEIRTPIALISVYSESILLGRYKPEKLKEYHTIIYQETNRLSGIVNKILNFSKIEEKKYQYVFASLSINEILENVLDRFSYHLNNIGFITEVNLSTHIPYINGDREALTEVVTNLIDNAIKYSDTEKYLKVETVLIKNQVVIQITDKGIGIPENQRAFIFDKFYRGSESDVHNIKGSGLGLAIVKHIVEGHGGSISVESDPGKGTCFKVMFPVLERELQS